MSTDYKFWKDIQERFKFFLMLAALCACGYLAWNQLIYIIFVLIFGGIAAAMAPLYKVSKEKIDELYYLDENNLLKAIDTIDKAYSVIRGQDFDNLLVIDKIAHLTDTLKSGEKTAKSLFTRKRLERERIDKFKREKQQEYEEWLVQKRREKGVKYGAPPDPSNRCPNNHPIRATENLRSSEPWRGIYYFPDDPDYSSEAKWCFICKEHAERDGYRRPKGNKYKGNKYKYRNF
ncbi:MAG: hypothetical protein F6J97_17475 [Leptolyngbya sp. SIO4C1]|nr:hypothetical protein [Leptolyngbya sp. SIO4C1]